MQSRTLVLVLVVISILSSYCLGEAGQTTSEPKDTSAVDINDVNSLSLPYKAEVTDDEVNIRSGPGMNYYRCGKLTKGQEVIVVDRKFSWSQIVPPKGSFSWISKQYVEMDTNSPWVGVVSGDEVRVWSGSSFVEPMHSTSLQTKLSVGDTVRLLGEEKGDYYKIVPPAGAYVWVSTLYTKYKGPIEKGRLNLEITESAKKKPQVTAAPKKSVSESSFKSKYKQLVEQIDAERAKGLAEQDYSNLKKALITLKETAVSDKAARYASYQIKRIEGIELAIKASDEVRHQDDQLAAIRANIQRMRAQKLGSLSRARSGEFIVTGTFKQSEAYDSPPGSKRYLIVDDKGKAVCYAQPVGWLSNSDLSGFLNRKVGLKGSAEAIGKNSVVKFAEIIELP